jgi:hypothetical protein
MRISPEFSTRIRTALMASTRFRRWLLAGRRKRTFDPVALPLARQGRDRGHLPRGYRLKPLLALPMAGRTNGGRSVSRRRAARRIITFVSCRPLRCRGQSSTRSNIELRIAGNDTGNRSVHITQCKQGERHAQGRPQQSSGASRKRG